MGGSTVLDRAHLEYLAGHRQGRLATIARDGTPQNKPVGYVYNPGDGTIDIGGFEMASSAKYRNVAIHPDVSFVVDDAIGQGAAGMRFIEVRGKATHATRGNGALRPEGGEPIIRIDPRRLVSWNIGDGPARYQTFNLAPDRGTTVRPSLGLGPGPTESAVAAVTQVVEELQAGLESRDADLFNRSFAQDVIWGSPYGATVNGYERLHAIHTRLHQDPVALSSRYEIVRVLTPASGVAIAQVARYSLDARGLPIEPNSDPASDFSEMALHVLVRREGQWWLAAGQNTQIRPGGFRL